MSPDFSWEIKGKQRNNGAFASPTVIYSVKSVYNLRKCMRTMSEAISGCEVFPSEQYSKVIANIASKNVIQVRTKKCKTRSFTCEVNLNFFSSSRHFGCDRIFCVIVSLMNERVHSFHKIGH